MTQKTFGDQSNPNAQTSIEVSQYDGMFEFGSNAIGAIGGTVSAITDAIGGIIGGIGSAIASIFV